MPVRAPVAPAVKPAVKPAKPRVKPPAKPQPAPPVPEPLWHVILLNDEDHTYDYVIEMLNAIFSHNIEKAYRWPRKSMTMAG